MSSHSPASPALAALRQMACLDLGGPQMIEPVLRELRRAIGFESASYVHPGGDPGAPDMQVYVEDPALQAASPGYFDPHVQRSEGQVFHHSLRQFHEAARHEPGPRMLEQMAKVPYASLMRSDFYDALLRPARVVDWVSLALRTPQGRALAPSACTATPGRRAFDRKRRPRSRRWRPAWPACCSPARWTPAMAKCTARAC
ncbi:hypothetical protein [Paenacidovorax monticola]|uniref:hypothetical protein n=1 Tax=Paenacidovorax monticola TaxID=1926868 RepID=UPI001FE8A5BA|nr:hypothetical protein [Paenacidovorax monticola]